MKSRICSKFTYFVTLLGINYNGGGASKMTLTVKYTEAYDLL